MSLNPIDRLRAGSIGKRLPGVEVRLAEDCELLVSSSALFSGYYRDPRAVARVNCHLAPFEQIRKFRVLDRDFSIEHGELTATMKLRRGRVLENHRALIAEMYAGREDLQ